MSSKRAKFTEHSLWQLKLEAGSNGWEHIIVRQAQQISMGTVEDVALHVDS